MLSLRRLNNVRNPQRKKGGKEKGTAFENMYQARTEKKQKTKNTHLQMRKQKRKPKFCNKSVSFDNELRRAKKLKSRKNTKHRAQQTSQQNTTQNKLLPQRRRRRRRRRPCNNNNNKVVAKKPPPGKQPQKKKKREKRNRKKSAQSEGERQAANCKKNTKICEENLRRSASALCVVARKRASDGGRASRLCLVSLAT
jgi:hypothetical protein